MHTYIAICVMIVQYDTINILMIIIYENHNSANNTNDPGGGAGPEGLLK